MSRELEPGPEAEALLDEARIFAAADYVREVMARQRILVTGGRKRPAGGFAEAVEAVGHSAYVNPHQPIAWPHWPPGLVPKLLAALQKVTRRLLAWYINPIVQQQNTYNHNVLRALQDSDLLNQRLIARVRELERESSALSQRVAQLEGAAAPERAPKGLVGGPPAGRSAGDPVSVPQ
jgi:hypothetical protein